jgi:hypothetical protein
MAHDEVVRFIKECIIYRFGMPQTLTMDQRVSFMLHQLKEFAESLKVRLLNSSPYYAQANDQDELSNKVLIKLIKKKIDENSRRWHEVLPEALWAHKTSRHGATKITPFELVYGQEAVLPVEVNLQTCQVTKQEAMLTMEYMEAMMDQIDGAPESRLEALRKIEKDKLQVARAYNKRVKAKSFQLGELVWKTILPIGA